MASLLGRAALAGAGLILLAACSEGPLATGPVRTETRPVGDFDSIDIDGATRLQITVGVPASLEVEGRDPFLQRLRTEVHGDTLHIKVQRKDWVTLGTSPRLTVRVGIPSLEKLEVQGGNDVRITGFNGGDTRIELEGATNLVADGRVDELRISMAGAGHADLGDLIATDADVTVAGVGSIFVHPTASLDATMNGVGAIFYTGNPSNVSTRMNGLGTIGKRDAGDLRRERGKAPIDPDSLQPEYDPDEPVEKDTKEGLSEVV
ncbi:GIN domain-containing protein [Povalibacter sp.]|uniref:GIN domain-containing protein n=1 Tax=Povalibacter sp. TaxID=1962978 RepID=UPI002F3E448B